MATAATGQLGSFSRRQANAAGSSDGQLRRRVQSGFLDQIGPHAFRLVGAEHGLRGDVRGLVCDIGEPCWISGPTAAALHGFDGYSLRRPLHVTVLRDRNVRRMGVVVHTTACLPEVEFLRLVAGAGLPRPLTQQVLTKAGDRLVRVDCRFSGTAVVVELLGYRHHRTKEHLNRDAERLNALILDGFTPFQFTYDQVVGEPQVVIGTLHVALLRSA